MSDLREILQRELDIRGWNAYDLEKHSGVPQPTNQRFLSGKHGDPKSSTVQRWAHALGISEAELRGLESPGVKTPKQTYNVQPKLSATQSLLISSFEKLTPAQQDKFIDDLTKIVEENQRIFDHLNKSKGEI